MSRTKASAVGSWIRQSNRWIFIIFTAAVIANFTLRATMTTSAWVTYSLLLPLAILLSTGLYRFVLSYTVKWRRGSAW